MNAKKITVNFHIVDGATSKIKIQGDRRVRVILASILEVQFLFNIAEVFTIKIGTNTEELGLHTCFLKTSRCISLSWGDLMW